MDALLDSLGQLLIKALPTFILLILFHFYIKWMFYGPLDKLLKKRFDATEGARKIAEESMAQAERKAAEYERAVRSARADLLVEQEAARKRLQSDQGAAIAAARKDAEAMVSEAKAELAQEVAEAKKGLAQESEAMAEEIVTRLLERKAS
jgi:F-type H+-transporting ATPase subunit b